MANIQNLQPGNVNHTFTPEETLKGVKKSIEVRQQKALLRNSLQLLLKNNIKIPNNPTDRDIKDLATKLKTLGVDTKKMQVNDLVNCGLILGAIYGKAENYKTILETTGEISEEASSYSPQIEQVESIVDNSNLEKVLYEENKH